MKKKIDYPKIFSILNLFLIPLLFSILVIFLNNYEKFSAMTKTGIVLLIVISFVVSLISFICLLKEKRIFNRNHIFKKIQIVAMALVFSLEIFSLLDFVYYNDSFKNWFIKSSHESLSYKGLATSLYSKYTVNDVVGKEESFEEELIDFDVEYDNSKLYANKFEEEILSREDDSVYKIIKITGTTISSGSNYVGYIAVVYDPSRVKLVKSTGAGTFEGSYGETLATMAKKSNALVAINAGGFYDPFWNSNGGIPHGDVFIDGELDSTYVRSDFGGGLIGFDYNNKLILKRMSTEEAKAMGIRDAVDWGPFLIVDGVNQFKDSSTSWECARTAIGQREDGVVLFLVIDGLQSHSKGASYRDLAEILERYGVVNASSLDGGTSTSMVENGEYINSPWNGVRPTFRRFPNAWIVTP